MNALAEQIKLPAPLKDLELKLDAATALGDLRKLPQANYKKIEARGFLHRKQNFGEWINALWSLLVSNGNLHLSVPLGAAAWEDPFAMREITPTCFGCFDVKSEYYRHECKPFSRVLTSIVGNELNASLLK